MYRKAQLRIVVLIERVPVACPVLSSIWIFSSGYAVDGQGGLEDHLSSPTAGQQLQICGRVPALQSKSRGFESNRRIAFFFMFSHHRQIVATSDNPRELVNFPPLPERPYSLSRKAQD